MDMKRGVIKAFDAPSYTATVQMAGSLSVWLTGLPVARNIPASEVVAGRQCTVLFFSDSNPRDAVVATVYT